MPKQQPSVLHARPKSHCLLSCFQPRGDEWQIARYIETSVLPRHPHAVTDAADDACMFRYTYFLGRKRKLQLVKRSLWLRSNSSEALRSESNSFLVRSCTDTAQEATRKLQKLLNLSENSTERSN